MRRSEQQNLNLRLELNITVFILVLTIFLFGVNVASGYLAMLVMTFFAFANYI